jgi:glycine betaine/proline transport system substrate-binding protein
VKKYIDEQGVATDLGPNGNKGIIGWYVPPWLAEAYPEVLDWKNLNDYASDFATAETAPKGQVLDGDPSYVTNDEALVKNLGLDYEVVIGGSEAALIQQFRKAEQNKEWLLAYFYSPQWFWSEMQPVRVKLPPYEEGCDVPASAVACDYPEYTLNKVASTSWVDEGGPAVNLVKNFQWTNEDQDKVAAMIASDGMDPVDAADQWISENQDLVDTWLADSGASPSPSS